MRINVIGAGARGRRIVEHLLSQSGVEVGFVADPGVEGRGRVASEFPHVTTTEEITAAIRDPRADAVVLATPPEFHTEFARLAVRSGKHLLVAAPLALSVDVCRELTEEAGKRDQVLALGYSVRFDSRVTELRELISSGELGHLRHVHVVHSQLGPHRGDICALRSLAADDLSILQHWSELTPVHVTATTGCYLAPGIPDVMDATLLYAGGLRGSLHVSWLSPERKHEMTIVGDRAMATIDFLPGGELVVHDRRMSVDSHPTRCRIRDEGSRVVAVDVEDEVRLQVQHFVKCIREGLEPLNGGDWATRMARQLVAIEHSAKEGGNRITIGLRRQSPPKGPLRRTFAQREPESTREIERPRAIRPKNPQPRRHGGSVPEGGLLKAPPRAEAKPRPDSPQKVPLRSRKKDS